MDIKNICFYLQKLKNINRNWLSYIYIKDIIKLGGMLMEQWNNFKGEKWKNSIDVKQFIIDNYTEYLGDESFLSATTEKTDIIMDACNKALKE